MICFYSVPTYSVLCSEVYTPALVFPALLSILHACLVDTLCSFYSAQGKELCKSGIPYVIILFAWLTCNHRSALGALL